jgi:hypothetical protein
MSDGRETLDLINHCWSCDLPVVEAMDHLSAAGLVSSFEEVQAQYDFLTTQFLVAMSQEPATTQPATPTPFLVD